MDADRQAMGEAMSNEPLGIYEELRARADYYGDLGEKLRKRLIYLPVNTRGAFAQPVNPFMRYLRNRIRVAGPPVAAGSRGYARHSQRAVWPEAKLGVSLDTVIRTVVDESETTMGQIFSTNQTWAVARPRQAVMYMIDRYCPDYSLPQIGFIFSRDHTTVMAAIDAVNIRLGLKHPETVDLVSKSHRRLRELAS